EQGNLVAMLGMDVPARAYILSLAVYALLPLLIALMLIILVVGEGIRRARREALLEQKAEFLSIASHQIRTPLIGIRWAVEQVLEATSLPERELDTLTLVHESTLDLIARVNNLLDVAAIEQRGLTPNQSILMRPLLEEITNSLELSAKRKSVHLRIDDSVAQELEVAGNRDTLQHIFFNLLGNAVKYTREGTEVTVSYAWMLEGHQFSVSDHGVGIPAAEQELIF